MAKTNDDMQKVAQTTFDGTLKIWGEWGKSWQAIAAEMGDYSKRSFEDGTKTLEQLVTARSVEQAVQIQSTYAKRSVDAYMRQMTRIGTMYADLAKEAGKPVEKLMHMQR